MNIKSMAKPNTNTMEFLRFYIYSAGLLKNSQIFTDFISISSQDVILIFMSKDIYVAICDHTNLKI